MKNLFTLSLFALCGLPLAAQTHDHALGFGYSTSPNVVCALADGRFMAAGTGLKTPGDLFTDTVFAVVYGADGQIDLRLKVPAPAAEIRRVIDAVPTPDGGFVLSVNSTLCDVVNDQISIFSYAPDGTIRWSKSGTWGFLSGQMALAPDGAVLHLLYDKILAFDYLTGDTLWQLALDDQVSIYDMAFIPGTEDFAAVGYPHLQFWRHTGAPGSHEYVLDHSDILPPYAYVQKMLSRADGNYTYDVVQNRFVRFDQTGYEVLSTLPASADFEQAADGFWFIGRRNLHTVLLKTNLLGQPVDSIIVSDPWLNGTNIALSVNTASIAGQSGSGPQSDIGNSQTWPGYQANHLWLRTFQLDNPVASNNESNASLKAVEQLSPVHAEAIPIDFPPISTLYNLSGGEFLVQVTNTGNTLLNQVDVLISFENNQFYDICFMKPAMRQHYDNLGLAPGQSTWLDFGDIEAGGQSSIPTEFCFWTAAPNEMPDMDHGDDAFCKTIALDIPPVDARFAIKVFPNPAGREGFTVELPEQISGPMDYQLFDGLGQMVRSGSFSTGQALATVSTDCLPPGLYVLCTGKWRTKVVLQP